MQRYHLNFLMFTVVEKLAVFSRNIKLCEQNYSIVVQQWHLDDRAHII